jgi:SAM-dependent methyltransferase
MQAYGASFARIYNRLWAGFAERVAPAIRAFYESTPIGQDNRALLDVCCGSGQLARHFLEHGYRAVGIDLSPHMLSYARENNASYVESGQARFVEADVASFTLEERFGLAVSTFDALNHLPDQAALQGCFRSVYPLLLDGGFLIFDLNTRAGLRRQWNGVQVQDTEELLLVNRGIYDEPGGRAWVKITGFARLESGLYERFEETAYNVAFDLAWVRQALLEAGWRSAYFCRMEDLGAPLAEPEEENRAFVVAYK